MRALIPTDLLRIAAVVALAACASACQQHEAVSAPVETGSLAYDGGNRLVFPSSQRPKLTLPSGEQREIRSLLNVRSPLSFGEFIWHDEGVPPGKLWVLVDLKAQTLSVFRGEHEIGTSVTLYGADEYPTPVGRFPILAKFKDHFSSSYDAPMPYTLRLTGDGVSIHGSTVEQGAATHGCVGVPIDFASLLFKEAKVGDEVVVVQSARTHATS